MGSVTKGRHAQKQNWQALIFHDQDRKAEEPAVSREWGAHDMSTMNCVAKLGPEEQHEQRQDDTAVHAIASKPSTQSSAHGCSEVVRHFSAAIWSARRAAAPGGKS